MAAQPSKESSAPARIEAPQPERQEVIDTLQEGEDRSYSSKEMARRGRLGAYTTHSMHDSREITRNARKKFLERFERQVDPDGVLDPAERARRAEHAKRAYFTRLAHKSAKARRAGGSHG